MSLARSSTIFLFVSNEPDADDFSVLLPDLREDPLGSVTAAFKITGLFLI